VWNSDPARFTVVAGWALDGDGECWRPHVWAWDRDAKAVIESSGSLRLIYLGALLADGEAADVTAESPAWLSIA
jgi:hypothetical protein